MKNELQNLPFDNQKFELAWNEWLQFRKERRLPAYRPTGLRKTFAMLTRISNEDAETAVKIIDQSIEQNWQGLHPLKNNNAKYHNSKSAGAHELLEELRANYGTKQG